MKRMKKFLPKLLIGLVILLVALYVVRNYVARKSVEVGVEKVTGFPMEIGSVNVGLFTSKVDVRNIKLMNPAGFEEKLFVDMPQLYVDYRFGSMLTGKPHVNEMLVDIKQLVIVKNAKGESNAMKLKGVVSSGDSSTKYAVDTLHLKVGTVTIKDYSRGKPSERNVAANLDATYKNLTDSTDISRLVLLTVMSKVPLPDIGIKAEDLKKGLGNVTTAAGGILKGATNIVGTATKGFSDTFKKIVPQKH